MNGPIPMTMTRIRNLILTLITLLAWAAQPGAASAQDCSGENLVAKMQREEPDRYQAMLDHFATIENGEGIFWKLEKAGIQPSYLFGTAHVTDQRVLDRLAAVKPVLEQSRQLIVEVSDLDRNLAQQVEIVRKYGMLPEGETLDTRLTGDEQKLLAAATAAHGMPWFSARRMKATFLALTMSIPACAKVAMLRGKKVLDAQLIEYARENNIPVLGLETMEEQLMLIDTLDGDAQLAALIEAVAAGGTLSEDMYETTIRLHAEGRIALLLSFMEQKKQDFPASSKAMENFEGPLIEARNRSMHERALPELESGNAFMAVGALHLPGETGLVRLFRDSGFSVTRVTNP